MLRCRLGLLNDQATERKPHRRRKFWNKMKLGVKLFGVKMFEISQEKHEVD